ncbi:MAG: kynureninase, partial [Verrucomicrobia bacterium]|nr:kynureninase [Verrucomicrobiota bacterium]
MAAFDSSSAHAHALDTTDPLAAFRAQFFQPANGAIYLDGNSLGLLSRPAEAAVIRALEDWKTRAIGGWLGAGWFDLAERLAGRLAPLVGAEADEVAVANSTTVNLHQLLATLYRPDGLQNKILAFAGEFPSDLYAIRSHLALRHHDARSVDELLTLLPAGDANDWIDEAAVERAFDDPRLQLAVLPAVVYTTGQLLDARRLATAAQRAGVILGFDLSHSIGIVPHSLTADGVDFAFWCHYKYLNAGPGAVGGLFLHRRHFDRAPGLAGWWGSHKERQFDMVREQTPARGAGALQIGTPPVLGMAALDGALAIIAEAGIAAIREKSLALTSYLTECVETLLPDDAGFRFANPREARRRGGHVALRHPAAGQFCRALRAAGVITDFRPPDILRLAPVPLYNTFSECHAAVARLREI